jgi:hypothetical protein
MAMHELDRLKIIEAVVDGKLQSADLQPAAQTAISGG